MVLLGLLSAPAVAAAEVCANAAVRYERSAALPRCRAYELVSPVGSEPEFLFGRFAETGAPLEGDGRAKGEVQASAGGDSFAYVTSYPPEGSPSDGLYLRVTRSASGWSAEEMIPPQSASYSDICRSGYIAAYAPELNREVLADGVGQPGSALNGGTLQCPTDDPPLVAGEPQGFQNLFLGESESGPYQLVDEIGQAPEGFQPAGAWFEAASDDLSHVVFAEAARLTSQGPAVQPSAELTWELEYHGLPDLYVWANGAVRLVTFLPEGLPVAGFLANGVLPQEQGEGNIGAAPYTGAVSADGSRVFFQARGNPQAEEATSLAQAMAEANLYLRVNAEQPQSPVSGGQVNGEQCTVPADACTVQLDAAQGGTESGGGRFMWATPDGVRVFFLDERRLTADSTAAAGAPDLYEYEMGAPAGERLRDLTAHTVNPKETANVLGVSGVSEDGSYVYFVADGALAENENFEGAVAVLGQPNLYLTHAGAITFIATLDPAHDAPDWIESMLTSRITPDGGYLAFNSDLPLTHYDDVDVASGERDGEIFLYSAEHGVLACVSCSPSGAPSTAYAKIPGPTRPDFGGGTLLFAVRRLQRSLASDGRVFFSTAQKLAPGGVDAKSNVYEYDAGELSLISTGSSEQPSYFYEASANGSDVFFITSQGLPSGEEAHEFRVYDAREDGGFANPPSGEECSGEGCRGPMAPLTGFAAPATTELRASGNAPTPAGEVKGAKVSAKTAVRVRREHLARALAVCRKKRNRRKRLVCEAQARHKYGVKKAARGAKGSAGKAARRGGV